MDVCELGFIEKADDPSHLTSSFFPSKLGGKPAWLDLLNIPSLVELSCGHCMKPLTFLLQVYAPLSDRNNDSAFHRTIFLFMCRDPNCHQHKNNLTKCFKVLRCQLSEVNDFYDKPVNGGNVEVETTVGEELERLKLNRFETDDCKEHNSLDHSACGVSDSPSYMYPAAPVGDVDEVVKSKPSTVITSPQTVSATSSGSNVPLLCAVCGVQGPKRCAKCQIVNYCSRDHQIHDWKSGHKLFCADLASGKCSLSDIGYDPSLGVALPLFEIVTELEPDLSSLEKQPERNYEERMADYHKFIRSKNIDECKEDTKKNKYREASDKKSDKQFKAFKKRVALEPEQVIRYQHGGTPLLVSSEGVPIDGEIPPCSCGAKRMFELQVMPQLLYYLKMDVVSGPSVDWGTLLIYTCADNCSTGPAYHQEFLWKQRFST